MKLRDKRQRFVDEYLADLNATQAALRAGYSARTAKQQGSRLLSNVDVASAIAAGQSRRSERTGVRQDQVLAELTKLGFANMADYMRAGPDGDPYLDFSALTRDQAAALQEVTVETFTVAGEEVVETLEEQPQGGALKRTAGREVRRVKFRLADKRAALVDIGRHLGMFKDRLELSGSVNTGLDSEVADDIARIFGLQAPAGAAAEPRRRRPVVSPKAHGSRKARARKT